MHQDLLSQLTNIKNNYKHILDFVFINDCENKILERKIIEGENGLFEINRIISIVQTRLGMLG